MKITRAIIALLLALAIAFALAACQPAGESSSEPESSEESSLPEESSEPESSESSEESSEPEESSAPELVEGEDYIGFIPELNIPIVYAEKFSHENGENNFYYYGDNGTYYTELTYIPETDWMGTAGDYWVLIQANLIHPGEANVPVIGFECPMDGVIDIAIRAYLRNTTTGDGYDGFTLQVLHGEELIEEHLCNQENPAWDGKVTGIEVKKGDFIYLREDKGSMNYGDECVLNTYTLTYVSIAEPEAK